MCPFPGAPEISSRVAETRHVLNRTASNSADGHQDLQKLCAPMSIEADDANLRRRIYGRVKTQMVKCKWDCDRCVSHEDWGSDGGTEKK